MKILSTIFVTVTLLVIGFLFLSSGVNNADSNVSKSLVKRTQNGEYYSQYKRRDFIMERRENERKEINREKNANPVDVGSHHEDFMVYNRLDDDRIRHDDFR